MSRDYVPSESLDPSDAAPEPFPVTAKRAVPTPRGDRDLAVTRRMMLG